MITCPLCGRKDCRHTIEDLGLTQAEFLVYCVFNENEDFARDPNNRREAKRIGEKIRKAVKRPNRP